MTRHGRKPLLVSALNGSATLSNNKYFTQNVAHEFSPGSALTAGHGSVD